MYSWPKIWLSVSFIAQKLDKYSQLHVDEKIDLSALGLSLVAPFDSAVTMWARSLEDPHAEGSLHIRVMLSICQLRESLDLHRS